MMFIIVWGAIIFFAVVMVSVMYLMKTGCMPPVDLRDPRLGRF